MRPGLSFSHVGFTVSDIAAMEAFYRDVLEFTVTDRGQLPGPNGPMDLVFLSRDPDEHHQIVLVTGRPGELAHNPINQISLKADSLATLRTMYQKLVALEMPNILPVTHGNAVSVYCPDPEGNRLELYYDLPWYVNQPMRVPVDFSMDDSTLMSWLEDHARQLPGFEPRDQWRARMVERMGLARGV